MKLIDADKLIAEIERLKERYGSIIPNSITAQNYQEGRLIGYEDALYIIKESLQQEQPEVELENEIDEKWDEFVSSEGEREDFNAIARHFYKLGLNASKED